MRTHMPHFKRRAGGSISLVTWSHPTVRLRNPYSFTTNMYLRPSKPHHFVLLRQYFIQCAVDSTPSPRCMQTLAVTVASFQEFVRPCADMAQSGLTCVVLRGIDTIPSTIF